MGGLLKRGKTWHLRMRVPVRYKYIEPRAVLLRSLKTGDEREARARAAVVERQILGELDARLLGRETPGSRSHYEAMATLTASRGFSVKGVHGLTIGPLEDVVRRVENLQENGDLPGSPPAKALLGAVPRPRDTLKEVAESMSDRFPLEVRDKNDKQRKVWKARWERPAGKVIEMLGMDPVLEDITRADAVSLRDALLYRVTDDDMKGASAQKELQNLDLLWRKYFRSLGVDDVDAPPSPFRGLGDGLARVDEESRKNEVPMSALENLLRPGTLDGMNDQLRDLVYVLAESGCRQSEVTDIPARSIFLDAEIPHLWIRHERGEDAREVKNKITPRKVPLLGVALDAMKRHPQGFPRYRGKGTFSAAANAYLKENGLLPDGVTIGGLRHSFESRLKAAGVDTDDRGELMGHSVKRIRGREHYGDSLSLEQRAQLMSRITLPVERPGWPRPA
jgi:integrase